MSWHLFCQCFRVCVHLWADCWFTATKSRVTSDCLCVCHFVIVSECVCAFGLIYRNKEHSNEKLLSFMLDSVDVVFSLCFRVCVCLWADLPQQGTQQWETAEFHAGLRRHSQGGAADLAVQNHRQRSLSHWLRESHCPWQTKHASLLPFWSFSSWCCCFLFCYSSRTYFLSSFF